MYAFVQLINAKYFFLPLAHGNGMDEKENTKRPFKFKLLFLSLRTTKKNNSDKELTAQY